MKGAQLYVNGHSVRMTDTASFITERGMKPGRFTFKSIDKVSPGDDVIFLYDGKTVFKGKVFRVSEYGRGYDCLAYDLLRYFNNKTTILYSDKTAGELLTILCNGYGIPIGSVADTKMKISGQIDDGRELFTIIGNALSLTSLAGYGEYVLYDDGGKICLTDAGSLYVGDVIAPESCREFTVTESIDSGVYNDVTLIETTEAGRIHHRFKNESSAERYGHLSYLGTLSLVENATATCTAILASNSSPITTVKCETYGLCLPIRGGASIYVSLNGEKKRMICDEAELIYGASDAHMKLTLSSV